MKKSSWTYTIALLCWLAFSLPLAANDALYNQAPFAVRFLDKPVKAPDFNLPDLNGGKIALAQFRGKVLLINFWGVWCPPCLREMPDLAQLSKLMSKEDFVVLAMDVMDSKERVQRFVSKTKLDLPVVMDEEGKIYPAYKVNKFPTSVLIDKQGRLVAVIEGVRDWTAKRSLEYFKLLARQ